VAVRTKPALFYSYYRPKSPPEKHVEWQRTNSGLARKVQFLAGQGALLSTTAEVFEIVQQHPERDGEYQYKIKSLEEPHLRVAKESQLRKV